MAEKDDAPLTERERALLDILAPAIRLLFEIVPLAEAYIRQNMLEDKLDIIDNARKFCEDFGRYRIKPDKRPLRYRPFPRRARGTARD
jgi:hypothetical protein